MQEETYTKDEYYNDWKSDNIKYLKDEFLSENYVGGSIISNPPEDFLDDHADEFEAYCRQAFKDGD